jgi:hypothetical protein
MAQLHLTPHNINVFTHVAGRQLLIADISDLGPVHKMPFEQLYDDACDDGIAVYNPKTGSTTYWHTSADVHDKDGDRTMWVLLPTTESCRKHPAVSKYVMHLLND